MRSTPSSARILCCALALPLGPAGCAGPLERLGIDLPSPVSEREAAVRTRERTGVTLGAAAGASSHPRESRAAAAYIAAGFERTEVPFTLTTKPVAEGRLSSTFGYRRNPTGFLFRSKFHNGIDWAAPAGTPVYAAGDGTVDKLYTSTSYGNYVRIAHDNGFETAYAHLSAFAEGLAEGSVVKAGQQIGAIGATGKATGNHLHFELIRDGKRVDPLFDGG